MSVLPMTSNVLFYQKRGLRIIMEMIMAITVVRDVTPYSLVDIYRSLRRHIPENSNFYVRAQSSCEK